MPLFPQPLLDALAAHPDRPAVEHGTRVVTAGELLAMVRTLVAEMRTAGLGPGSGVALHTAITPEALAANLAVHTLGCRAAGIRPGWDATQTRQVLAGVDALVGDPATLTWDVLAGAHALTVLSLGPHPRARNLLDPGSPNDDEPLVGSARPDDVARLTFTSGSTGRPKACARTYRTYSLDFDPDHWAPDLADLVARFERFLVHHSLAVPVMLTFAGRCLLTGGTVVLADDSSDPSTGASLPHALARHRITGVVAIVPLLHRMLEYLRAEPVELPDLQALVVTGSTASPSLLAAAVEALGPKVWQGYGQAESGMIALLTPDDVAEHGAAAMSTVGRPLPQVELSLRDPDDRPVGPGEPGEVCVRSPHVMAGYWGEPVLTGEVLVDGWLHTRDLGRLDETGLLHLTGRSRDVIIVNAEVCYAGAIEQALARHPDVAQAYVVGLPDERTGEAVHALVLPVAGRSVPRVDALRDLVRAELTAAHVPRAVVPLRHVPVAASGKPDRRALTALARATTARAD